MVDSRFLVSAGSEIRLLVEVPIAKERRKGGSVPTVFVDRDGVINANRAGHVRSWDQFEFLPGALEGLALFARQGWRVVVITNQSAVNRGFLPAEDLDALHRQMVQVVAERGGDIAAVYVCPHRPDEGCRCRKPEPGLLLAAARDFGVSLAGVVFVGDQPTDLEAARRAGCRSVLVLSELSQSPTGAQVSPECLAVVPGLYAAARQIVDGRPTRAGQVVDSSVELAATRSENPFVFTLHVTD